ncbi:hypothetical protein BC831DRAFT_476469 [Entophlyctis helioformis]|nr:hypothetical protein BC831DRAFT_476469 [Entophlyctis helioformis]
MCFIRPQRQGAATAIALPSASQLPLQQPLQQDLPPFAFEAAVAALPSAAASASAAATVADVSAAAPAGLGSLWSDLGAMDPLSGDNMAALDSLSGDNLDAWLDLLSSTTTTTADLLPAKGMQLPVAPLFMQQQAQQHTQQQAFALKAEDLLSAQSAAAAAVAAASASLMPSPPASVSASLLSPPADATPYQRLSPSFTSPFTCSLGDIATSSRLPVADNQQELPLFPTMLKAEPEASPSLSATSSSAKAARRLPHLPRRAPHQPSARAKDDEDEDANAEEKDDSPLAVKRARNNEAARRSRERKMRRLEELEVQVTALDAEKADLLVRLAVVENERTSWMNRERELVHRVLALESQLGESHRALMQIGMLRNNNNSNNTTAKAAAAPVASGPMMQPTLM